MRKLLLLLAILVPSGLWSQTQAVNLFCQLGGKTVSTSGLNSTTTVQASYPKCTVTVYLTGTSTLATVFSNGTSSPLSNPFQANTDGSFIFWASTTACYDVVTSVSTSGGAPPMPNPFTYTDICLGSGGGGGGSGVNPGTPFQVTRYDSTGANIQDSTGSDNPANGPSRWVQGLSVEGNAGYRFFVNSPAGTTLNLLVCRDTTVTTDTQVTTCPTGSNSVFGLADNGAGVTGNVRTAMIGFHPCIFDNQTVIGDWVVPSASVAGECDDAGATKPNNQQVLGHVTTLNTGAATLATVDLFTGDTIAPGGGGSPVNIVPCAGSNCNAFYPSPNVIQGDTLVTDDANGNMTMKSAGFTDTTYSGFNYITQGPLPVLSHANSVYHFGSTSIANPFGMQDPSTLGSAGQCYQILSTATDPVSGNIYGVMGFGACGAAGQVIQVNGTPITTESPANFQNGTGIAITNPSAGNILVTATGTTPAQALNPSAPVLTTNGVAGATSDTYLGIGCEDVNCIYHSAASATTTIATANATLTSSNSINLKSYADTLYGYRFYKICRTAAGGTPSTTGVIATGAGKQFIDTGLAGDGTNCASVYSANTTILDQHCLASALPTGLNVMPGAPCGVDAPPTSPKAADDEMTPIFGAPADLNNPVWSWLNQNSATATWSNGNIVLTAAARGSFNITCVLQPVTTAPYAYVGAFDDTWLFAANSANQFGGMGFYEQSSGKLYVMGLTSILNAVGNMNLYRANPGFVSTAATGTLTHPGFLYEKFANDATNVVFSTSPDNITYTQQFSEAKNAFFTTAPSHVGFCFSPFGAMSMDIDYFRQILP